MFEFWKVVAAKFRSNDNVIGYDILNEPWVSNLYKDVMLFFDTQKFDRTKLFPMAQKADAAIRTIDAKKIIFFEPCQIPDTLPIWGGIPMPVGFPETPGGSGALDKQVLNDHSYCCQAGDDACLDGEPQPHLEPMCRVFHAAKA
jgi:endoglycosylceramidase